MSGLSASEVTDKNGKGPDVEIFFKTKAFSGKVDFIFFIVGLKK